MIAFDGGALADLQRIISFNRDVSDEWALRQLAIIRSALEILEEHPRIGRPVSNSVLRELVISTGKTGYVALYEWDELDRVVRVVGVRHQREAGYPNR